MNTIESTLQRIKRDKVAVRIEYGFNNFYVEGYITDCDRDFINLKEDGETKHPDRENIIPMTAVNRIILINSDNEQKRRIIPKPGFL